MVTISDTTEFYVDEAGEHRWRCRAVNGRIIGASSEGFSSADMARKNAGLLGIALTIEAREKLILLCHGLEGMGFKLTWKAAVTDDQGYVTASHWEIDAP